MSDQVWTIVATAVGAVLGLVGGLVVSRDQDRRRNRDELATATGDLAAAGVAAQTALDTFRHQRSWRKAVGPSVEILSVVAAERIPWPLRLAYVGRMVRESQGADTELSLVLAPQTLQLAAAFSRFVVLGPPAHLAAEARKLMDAVQVSAAAVNRSSVYWPRTRECTEAAEHVHAAAAALLIAAERPSWWTRVRRSASRRSVRRRRTG